MTTKWLSRRGVSLQGQLNAQKKEQDTGESLFLGFKENLIYLFQNKFLFQDTLLSTHIQARRDICMCIGDKNSVFKKGSMQKAVTWKNLSKIPQGFSMLQLTHFFIQQSAKNKIRNKMCLLLSKINAHKLK